MAHMQIYQHSREAHSILGFFPEFHGVCPRLKCRTLRLEIVGVYQIAPPMLTHVTQVWFDIVKHKNGFAGDDKEPINKAVTFSIFLFFVSSKMM